MFLSVAKFLAIIFSNIASTPPSPFWNSNYKYQAIPLYPMCLRVFSVFSIIFSCHANWKFSTHLSSSWPICSSTVSNMQLNPSIEVPVIGSTISKFPCAYLSFQFSAGILYVAIQILERINHSWFEVHVWSFQLPDSLPVYAIIYFPLVFSQFLSFIYLVLF